MMNEILVKGRQMFMNKEIPVVSGGFGSNKKCISDKTIADIHGMNTFHIRELINKNIHRFKESVDFIDLSQRIVLTDTFELLTSLGYAKQSITQAEHIYLLSERGYAKLIKIMDSDLAWEIHDKLMDEYFAMRDEIIPNMTGMIATLESEILGIKNELNQITSVITNKVDTGFNSMKKVKLDYFECISDSNTNESYKKKNKYVNSLITQIKNYGNYDTDNKVFSKIYHLMNEKCGIDINKCRENYVFQNPDKQNISPWSVIVKSPIVYDMFVSIAEEMLRNLKTYGSTEDYIIASNFNEATEQLNILAKDKYNSNKLDTYKKVYKCMEKVFNVDWSTVKNKSKNDAVKENYYLQELFIKSVNYLQYKDVA